ncbi:MAG: DHH family phosphoesterase [Chloroflexi bacterium]|nr:DHH family phosphoesterase [Chloroflexota bacterium]
MSKAEFLSAVEEGIARMRETSSEVTVVHHNDSDGLASAAVMKTALTRAGFAVRRIPLERVHPPIIERIHRQFPSTIMYVDLGGKGAPVISEANRGQRLTLIVDHHHPEESTDPQVLNITTEFYGLSGDMDISAATAAYLFAQVLDAGNRDLAYLGVIGAVGDSHERGGRLVEDNRQALIEAVDQGHVRIEEVNGREQYFLTRFGDEIPEIPMKPFAKSLTTLGAAGYYMNGPALAVRMLLEGPFPEAQEKLEELNRTKKAAYDKVLRRLQQEGFHKTEHIQWFVVGEDFAPMGVKIIGEFCMEIRDADFVDPDKYIVGFQTMDGEVPELGTFDWTLYKASMRVPSALEKRIVVDRVMPGLAYLVPEAAKKVDGSIDACHDYAAATVISVGREAELVAAMEALVAAR